MTTDPYGSLSYCIGSADDFWCFDYEIEEDQVTLHAVINSETGSFIQDAEKITVHRDAAIKRAMQMVGNALDWCEKNGVVHDRDGWNQVPTKIIWDLTEDLYG